MSANPLAVAARRSLQLLAWQTAWVLVVALIGAIIGNRAVGISLLIGGGIGLLWTAYMTLIFFRHSLTHGRQMSLATVINAWLIKLALTIGLLVVAFRSPSLVPLAVLGGLVGALVSYWLWFVLGPRLQRTKAAGESTLDA
ncbi:MAG TPA: ATP synthase subunit I [Steroidobacteraceae bacterium]|nr:ATP synthase subunit I [Steroidobacteraceae bacterium]